jgi:hypothetical protein
MKLEWKLDSHTMNWIGYGDGLECHGVVECEKATFQEIHDAKIDNIAAANGYVKLEPGQCVVQVEDLTRIVTWFRGDGCTVPHADMDTTLNRFAAALDASNKE